MPKVSAGTSRFARKGSQEPSRRDGAGCGDRKTVRFAVPPLRLAGMPEPVHAFIEFDAKTVDATIERLTILRNQMLPPLPAPAKRN